MISIPREIREFINSQGIFAVGSIGGTKFCNVSPRIFFLVTEDLIYWLDFFKHKSIRNFTVNPWVTISVYDKNTLEGYQIKGIVNFLTKEPEKSEIRKKIIDMTLKSYQSKKVQNLSQREAQVIKFRPKVIYELNPEKFSDLSIGSDIDAQEFLIKRGK